MQERNRHFQFLEELQNFPPLLPRRSSRRRRGGTHSHPCPRSIRQGLREGSSRSPAELGFLKKRNLRDESAGGRYRRNDEPPVPESQALSYLHARSGAGARFRIVGNSCGCPSAKKCIHLTHRPFVAYSLCRAKSSDQNLDKVIMFFAVTLWAGLSYAFY